MRSTRRWTASWKRCKKWASTISKCVVPPGSGDGLLENILGALIRDGYAGFLSLEPHLSDFTGFGALEKGRHQEWRALSGEAAFRLAHDALMEILNRL